MAPSSAPAPRPARHFERPGPRAMMRGRMHCSATVTYGTKCCRCRVPAQNECATVCSFSSQLTAQGGRRRPGCFSSSRTRRAPSAIAPGGAAACPAAVDSPPSERPPAIAGLRSALAHAAAPRCPLRQNRRRRRQRQRRPPVRQRSVPPCCSRAKRNRRAPCARPGAARERIREQRREGGREGGRERRGGGGGSEGERESERER